jgi:hypothetical protein
LNILHIAHIIIWKIINEQRADLQDGTLHGQDALQFALVTSKNFMLMATQYLVMHTTIKSMPSSSSFITHLITYINRVLIVNKDWFINEILQTLF